MKKVIIIGASSGIGYDLAKIFAANQFAVGITARREENLKQLQAEINTKCCLKKMDITQFDDAIQQLQTLIDELGGLDIIVINSGVGLSFPTREQEIDTIQVNAAGFVSISNYCIDYFMKQGHGHIVGISSIASIRGSHIATVYSATKAFISSYMQGLRYRFFKKKINIHVTDIRPGFVATPMTEKNKGMFWVATSQQAAQQIFDAIIAKKEIAYITKRWVIFATLYKLLPDFLVKRLA